MYIQVLPAALAARRRSAFGRYLEAERGRSAHTVRAYLSDVESLLAHAATEGVQDLAGVELGTLRRWLGAQSESGKSRATLARRAATARAFTAWAVREELIEADPALRLKAPKREKSLPGVLHQHQVRRLVDDAEAASAEGEPLALRNRAMVELLYATGRPGRRAGRHGRGRPRPGPQDPAGPRQGQQGTHRALRAARGARRR